MQTIPDTRQQLLTIFDTLAPYDQQRLLAFAQDIANEPASISGAKIAAIAVQNPITLTQEEIDNMQRIWDEAGIR